MKFLRPLLILVTVYASWEAMMAVHELGHVLHAWFSGGRVMAVHVPAFGFSRTDVSPNPSPAVVAWGGPVWGSLLPVVFWLMLRGLPPWIRRIGAFFGGLCLVANGAYLGVGWTMGAGDAADLLRFGTPLWMLIVFGAITLPAGFALWHTLGPRFGLIEPMTRPG